MYHSDYILLSFPTYFITTGIPMLTHVMNISSKSQIPRQVMGQVRTSLVYSDTLICMSMSTITYLATLVTSALSFPISILQRIKYEMRKLIENCLNIILFIVTFTMRQVMQTMHDNFLWILILGFMQNVPKVNEENMSFVAGSVVCYFGANLIFWFFRINMLAFICVAPSFAMDIYLYLFNTLVVFVVNVFTK